MYTDTDTLLHAKDLLRWQGIEGEPPYLDHCSVIADAIYQHEENIGYLVQELGSISGATSLNLARLNLVKQNLAALKDHQNYLLAPISRIPSELLHYIFSLYVAHYMDRYQLSNHSRSSILAINRLPWISITHVCRKWRQIVINDPCFWTQISPSSQPKWTKEMIARSQNLPLFVKADCFYMTPEVHSATKLILGEMTRIQELSLIVAHIDTVSEALVKPAPTLQCFSIRIYRQMIAPYLPADLFAGEFPQLRELSLDFCQVDWTSALWSRLTHLRLGHIRFNITIYRFMDLLRTMTQLKELSLESAFPADHRRSHLVQPLAPVHLPNLSKISIEEPSDFASILMECLHLPLQPATWVSLWVQRQNAQVALEILLNQLILKLMAPNPIPLRCLVIEDLSFHSMRILGCKKRNLQDSHFTLRLSDNLYGLVVDDYAVVKDLFLSAPAVKDHVQTLHLRGEKAGIAVADIHFPEVDMVVTNRAAALAWLPRAMAAEEDSQRLPKLRSLHFSEPLSVHIEGIETPGSEVLAALTAYLRQINQNDFKLALVQFPQADAHDPDLAGLDELVWRVLFSDLPTAV